MIPDFQDFQHLMAWREDLLQQLEAGRITLRAFRTRVRRAVKKFNRVVDARRAAQHYLGDQQRSEAHT